MAILYSFFLATLLLGTAATGLIAFYKLAFDSWPFVWGKALGLMASIFGLGFLIRMWGVVHEHVFFDGYMYSDVAWNILLRGKVAITLKGSFLNPEIFDIAPRPGGYSLLLASLYAIGWQPSWASFLVNSLLGSFSIILFYRIAFLLFSDHAIASWSALFLALLPAHIQYSACAHSNVPGFFFLLLSFMFLLEYDRKKREIFLLSGLFAGCFSAYIRPEYGLFVIAGLIVWLGPLAKGRDFLIRKRGDVYFILICLLLPLSAQVSRMIALEYQHANGIFISLPYLLKHLCSNIGYLFSVDKIGILQDLAFLTGVSFGFRHKKELAIWLIFWLIAGLLVMSTYFAGSFNERSLERHILVFIPAFLLLAGLGMKVLYEKSKRYRFLALIVIILLLLPRIAWEAIFSVDSKQRDGHAKEEARQFDFRDDRRLLLKAEPLIPKDAYIIHTCPDFIITETAKKAISEKLFLAGDRPFRIAYFKGYFWHQYEWGRALDAAVLLNYSCKTVITMPATGKKDTFSVELCERKH